METNEQLDAQKWQMNLENKINELQELVLNTPKDSLAWLDLAHFQSMNQQYHEAFVSALKAQELNPDSPEPLFKIGHMKFKTQDISGALQAFEQCVAICERVSDFCYLDGARLCYAQCLFLKGDSEKAASILAQTNKDTGVWLNEYLNPDMLLARISA